MTSAHGSVLVTGASGLIGRHAVAELLKYGFSVRTFHRGAALSADVPHHRGDVATDTEALAQATHGCQAVVHLAGQGDVAASRREPLAYAQINASGALHALEAARHAGAAFVLASTQRVYRLRPEPRRENEVPLPDSPYGFAKLAAELWCRMESEQFGVPTTVLRFFSVYGPGQQANGVSGVISIFARAALEGRPLQVQSAGKRDFTDARDAGRGIRLAIERPAIGFRVLNLATGVGTSFLDAARAVVQVFESQSDIQVQSCQDVGADLVADVSKAERELTYRPDITLTEGLHHYREWLLEQQPHD